MSNELRARAPSKSAYVCLNREQQRTKLELSGSLGESGLKNYHLLIPSEFTMMLSLITRPSQHPLGRLSPLWLSRCQNILIKGINDAKPFQTLNKHPSHLYHLLAYMSS